ncbi:hypothetical protein GYB73_03110 [Sinorhizobium meliloti]|nr:hypothetical protein [Sinorhizobium meliloti]
MGGKEKMKQLIWDCQKEIAADRPPESGISEHELLQMLIARLHDARRRKRWVMIEGWGPDDDGGGDRGSPVRQDREMA